MLKSKPPGTFLVRDSQGFPGSYGLAVKVETLPPGILPKQGLFEDFHLINKSIVREFRG
jgi:tensin